MSRILIVKTGTTFPSLKAARGDFETWISAGFGKDSRISIVVADVASGEPLPPATRFAGVVITGSHAMVTDQADWAERTATWLAKAVRASVPTLGICFGHQLLAYALGGRVAANPNGLEVGTVVVTPNTFGDHDLLLGGFQGPFKAHMCHRQSVIELPRGAVPLASTRREPFAAFSINRCAWGVQFHPEFDGRIAKAYALHAVCELTEQGQDVEQILSSCMDTGSGREIFRRFLTVVSERLSRLHAQRPFARAM